VVDGGEQLLVSTRHRDHRFPGRGRRITVRLDDAEHAAIVLAAGRAGLTPTGYVGAVALAAATGTAGPAGSEVREALAELVAARALGPEKRPVYHLVIAARKDAETGELVDRWLSDGEWADIAETYLDRIGLAPRGDDLGVRWVAVRHADDHVHVVATLARQDGRRVFPHNDFWRAGEASRAVEAKYGLTVTAASDRTAAKRPSYAEAQKAARRGQAEPVRETLRRSVRTAAAGAASPAEFLERLRDEGLLVRERMSERTPGQITGYAVALPDAIDPGGQPIYYGGGKLAADLTLPKLRRRWDPAAPDSDASQASGGDRKTDGGRRSAGASSTPPAAEGPAGSERLRLTAESGPGSGNRPQRPRPGPANRSGLPAPIRAARRTPPGPPQTSSPPPHGSSRAAAAGR